ncbi:hypothetical protein [Streptomyces venezuelae]|uniref:hypothetical protein n=1 Tax=Streptomyces venezuelae TaxID=54571 RepID=UPI003793673A
MTETTAKKTTKRPARKPDPATAVLAEVKVARKAYAGLSMPVAGGHNPPKGREHHEREANRWMAADTARKFDGVPGWDSALLAQAYRTLSEREPERVRSGLVRLAALAVSAVESLDREAE